MGWRWCGGGIVDDFGCDGGIEWYWVVLVMAMVVTEDDGGDSIDGVENRGGEDSCVRHTDTQGRKEAGNTR